MLLLNQVEIVSLIKNSPLEQKWNVPAKTISHFDIDQVFEFKEMVLVTKKANAD